MSDRSIFETRAGSPPTSTRYLSRALQLWIVLALAGAIVAWQLLIPPIIGLADQGDFVRVLGPLGFSPQPKGPEHKYDYVTRKYVKDPSYRQPRWGEITSELIPAEIAVTLNGLIADSKTFDITVFGFTHAVLFLIALARLLYVTRPLTRYWLVWALMLLILTDVGYVSYWNSLYTEPASCLWFLFFLAESISLCNKDRISMGSTLCWSAFAVLWITAKTQNAALCIPLAAYGFGMLWRTLDRKAYYAGLCGLAAICLAGVIMYRSLLPALRMTVLYDVIFHAILPESDDPQSDLRALGLNPEYVKYSGTLAWSPGTGVADGALVNAVQAHVSSIGLMGFYLKRPARMCRHLETVLATAFDLRPECCGNFDRSAGRPPGARSEAIAAWSWFHEAFLSRIACRWTGSGRCCGSLARLFNRRCAAGVRHWTELGICLGTCCLTAFYVAAFGDAWEPIKHQFLFNLLFDTCLVFGFVAAVTKGR